MSLSFRKKSADARLKAELDYHLEELVREFTAAGIDPAEARRRALLEFGGVEQIKEECRDVRGRWWDDFTKDLRYGARTLSRSPGFLAAAVLSLALGIGANSAIFSLVNAVMLQTLPVREPHRLVQIARIMPNGEPGTLSYPLFQSFERDLKSVAKSAAQLGTELNLVMDATEETVVGELVSGAYYQLLELEPAAGRLLDPADDVVSPASPSAVISYRYWQRRFASNPDAIGKTFSVRNQVFTIVGVTPPRFDGTRLGRLPDVTLPLAMMLTAEQRAERTNNMLGILARLQPGATVEQANAELQVLWLGFLQAQAGRESPKNRAGILSQRARVFGAPDGINRVRHDFSEPLLVLMGIVALVLLLACANLSGMMIARAAARKREISIRLAIGASRGRLLRQFLTESLLLAILGGSLGLLLAQWLSTGLVQLMANGTTLQLSPSLDWRVVAFTFAISMLACLAAGAAPGWHALRTRLAPGLKEVRAGSHTQLGKALVIAQLSISMVLLVGATLFVGTLVKLYRVDRGIQTNHVLMFSVRSNERYPQEKSWDVQKIIVDRVRALPGVASASAAQVVPLSGGLWTRQVQVEGYAFRPGESEDVAFNVIAPGYFTTLGTGLLSGREFSESDTNTRPKVAIVNESFAHYFFGGKPALGRRVTSVNVPYEIVGVVKDAKYRNLRQTAMKTMYIPSMQREGDQPSSYSYLALVRSADPMQMVPALERMVREADPALRLRSPQTYSTVIDRSIVAERLMAILGGFFGLLALIVAALGVFGVMTFQVSRRTNEIGLRMALGASRQAIAFLLLREIAFMLLAGSLVGGAAALTLTGLARKLPFGMTPTEPAAFALAALLLGITACTAAFLPARRATRVDPIMALRHE